MALARDHTGTSASAGLAFSFGPLWAIPQAARLLRLSLGNFSSEAIQRFMRLSTWGERAAFFVSPVATDPRTLQRLVQSVKGTHSPLGGGSLTVVRDFDAFVRASASVRARGRSTAEVFHRLVQGSAFTAEPRPYYGGKCPFGVWGERKPAEPHLLCKDLYAQQLPSIRALVDDALAPRVGDVVDLGPFLRTLVWDVMIQTNYGVAPDAATRRQLALFEAQSDEFDFSVRVPKDGLAAPWSDRLKAEVQESADWTWAQTAARKAEIDAGGGADRTDVLSLVLRNFPPEDLRKLDGALRAVFAAGFNNTHAAICGLLIENADQGDAAFRHIETHPTGRSAGTDQVLRETLRLFTAIPNTRTVQPEDSFTFGGDGETPLRENDTVLLSTIGVNTDPLTWGEDANQFRPGRFEGRADMAFMTQKGFVPFGVADELGGRQCGGAYYSVHLLTALIDQLLGEYKFTKVGKGHFDFKQVAGAAMFAGQCKMRIEKREA